MTSRTRIVIGTVLTVVGFALFISAIMAGAPLLTTDIEDEAIARVESPGTLTLEPGTYRVWFEFVGDDGEDLPRPELVERERRELRLQIVAPSGRPLETTPLDPGENFQLFVAYVDIEIEETGAFEFVSRRPEVFYLTEPISSSDPFFDSLIRLLAAFVIGGIGLGIAVWGLISRDRPGPVVPDASGI